MVLRKIVEDTQGSVFATKNSIYDFFFLLTKNTLNIYLYIVIIYNPNIYLGCVLLFGFFLYTCICDQKTKMVATKLEDVLVVSCP